MGERSVNIGGNAIASTIVTGDNNTVATNQTVAGLPAPETVDIRAEIAALRELLASLETPEQTKIQRALDLAAEAAGDDDPDRDEVGGAMERALRIAKNANGFAEQVEELAPRIKAVAGWLGENGPKLLAAVGLSL